MKRTLFLTTLFGAPPTYGAGHRIWVNIDNVTYAVWIDIVGEDMVSIKLKARGMTREKASELLTRLRSNLRVFLDAHPGDRMKWEVYDSVYKTGQHHCFSPRLICPKYWIAG